jgi:PAS domain S-box-containing protein
MLRHRSEPDGLTEPSDQMAADSEQSRVTLVAERTLLARREAAAEEVRRGFETAAALLSSQQKQADAERKTLQFSLEEQRVVSEELEEANIALAQANTILRERAEHLRLIFDNVAGYAIIVLDSKGRVTDWNRGAERLLGFGADDVVGCRLDAIWTPTDLAAGEPDRELRRAAEEGRSEDERWYLRKDGSRLWAQSAVTPLFDGTEERRGFVTVLRDRTAARAEEERRGVLVGELNHRVKNTLAVVQSITTQTLHNAGVPPGVQTTLLSRFAALARSHDLLTRGHSMGTLLPEIVRATLAPHAGREGRIEVAGSEVALPPSAVVTVNLAFHELATNAAKYGALSVPEGQVEVCWAVCRTSGHAPAVEIVWRERGGPLVRLPSRRGFGSRLIERGLAQQFGTTARLNFVPEGVECRIRLPLAPGIAET